MRRILPPQSELSIASALFYAAGGVISVLIITVFRDGSNPLNVVTLAAAVVSFALTAVILVLGRRIRRRTALLLLSLSAVVVLALVIVSQFELRAMNSGLLFYTFVIYLVWFGPMWFARVFGYTWLAIYCVAMTVKFSDDVRIFLTTLVLTSIILSELVGAYKNRLETSSLTDPLCGVWNKRAFEALLRRAVATSQRSGRPLSVMYLDLDGFKQINDGRGHAEGDRILQRFARDIEGGVRPQDVLARIGGDEFALLLRETDEGGALAVGARLRESATEVPWSFGVAELLPGEGQVEFTARADAMMLEEKRRRGAER